jgi:hypothetical protein
MLLGKGDLMRRLSIACSAAVLAFGLATAAHADEWTKLTLLTFSGPVDMPGITLPAGTYRFELADPSSGRRAIRVSDKEGSKIHGIFLSISNQRMEPADKPLVMFGEAPSGAPQAVKAWFYPGETYGYEFVYPQDQAMKIASATHQPVLSMKDSSSPTTTDAERMASYTGAEVSRIDENGRPVSSDAELKESSSQRPTTTASTAAAATTTAAAATTTASTAQPSTSAQSSTTSQPSTAAAPATSAQASTAQSSTAPESTTSAQPSTTAQTASAAPPSAATTTASSASTSTAQSSTSARPSTAAQPSTAAATTATNTASAAPARGTAERGAVGTSGTANASAARGRDELPRTASQLPMIALLGALALAAGLGLRAARAM